MPTAHSFPVCSHSSPGAGNGIEAGSSKGWEHLHSGTCLSCAGGEGREVSVVPAWPCCHAGWQLAVERRPVSVTCWSREASGPGQGPQHCLLVWL